MKNIKDLMQKHPGTSMYVTGSLMIVSAVAVHNLSLALGITGILVLLGAVGISVS